MIFSVGTILFIVGMLIIFLFGCKSEFGWKTDGFIYYRETNKWDDVGAGISTIGLFLMGYSILKFFWHTLP